MECLCLQTFVFTQSTFAVMGCCERLWAYCTHWFHQTWCFGEFHVQYPSNRSVPPDETLFHQTLSQALPGVQPQLLESITAACSAPGQYCKIHSPQSWVKPAQDLREDGGKAIACIPIVISGRVGQSSFIAPSQSRYWICYTQLDVM